MGTEFGQRLRAAMLAAGVQTPAQLAAMCGINARTAGRYMRLEQADISAVTAEKIARALSVRLGWLITGLGPVAFGQEALDALIIIEQLSRADAERWLNIGRQMLEAG
jgi:transcriptional regulator with XRE-family HTH domain